MLLNLSQEVGLIDIIDLTGLMLISNVLSLNLAYKPVVTIYICKFYGGEFLVNSRDL